MLTQVIMWFNIWNNNWVNEKGGLRLGILGVIIFFVGRFIFEYSLLGAKKFYLIGIILFVIGGVIHFIGFYRRNS